MNLKKTTNIFSYFKYYKKALILGPILKTLEAISELLIPFLISFMIDNGILKNDIKYVVMIGLLIIGLVIFSFFTTTLCQLLAAKAAQDFGTRLRNDTFRKINSLSLKEVSDFSPSSLTARMTNDIQNLQEGLARLIRIVLRAPLLAIGSIVMALLINVKLGLIFVILTPIIVLTFYFVMKFTSPMLLKLQKKLDVIILKIKETLFGIKTITAYDLKEEKYQEFNVLNNKYSNETLRINNISNILSPVTVLLVNAALIIILYFGSSMVGKGTLLSGELIALVDYLTQMQLALVIIIDLTIFFAKVFASKKRIEEILNTENSLIYGIEEPQNNTIAIEFKNVDFKYKKETAYFFNNLNLTIQTGEVIGIIGGTGTGKSTVFNLISRLYDVDNGVINIFGTNIKNISKDFIYKNINYTLQKGGIFKRTIKENILMNSILSDEEVNATLKLSSLQKEVNTFTEKIDYQIYEEGKNLSGGQKGRLNLARSFAKKSQIYLFDDIFMALDSLTSKKIIQNILTNLTGKTILISSQKISIVKNLSRIIVLNEGNIVGDGTHEELLKNCSIYFDINASQEGNNL
jgi:ATP-binding cassette subfamily B protein